jgi:DNA-binding MarR family transcriptional regulator
MADDDMAGGAVTAIVPDGPALFEGLGCPDVHDERISLMGLLIEANGRLTRALGAELERECGLPLSFYDVLIRIGRSPVGRLTMSELAAQILLTSGGVTRLVDRMVESGYVERQSCPTDRRTVYVALTPAGGAKLADTTAVHVEGLERHLLGPLDEQDRAALRIALTKLVGPGPVCGG